MKWNAFLLEQARSADRAVEGSLARASDAVRIVHVARTIDTDADADVPTADEIAPLLRHESSVGLEGVANFYCGRPKPLDRLEDGFVIGDREYERLARMPDDRDVTPRIGRVEDPFEARSHGVDVHD